MTQMTTDTCRMKSEAEDPIGHLRNEYKLEDRGLFSPTRPQMVAKNKMFLPTNRLTITAHCFCLCCVPSLSQSVSLSDFACSPVSNIEILA